MFVIRLILLCAVLGPLVAAGPLCAQTNEDGIVAAQVMSVLRGNVYLSVGTAEGVQQGDSVVLATASNSRVAATILAVSDHHSMCFLEPAQGIPNLGTIAEIDVSSRTIPASAPTGEPEPFVRLVTDAWKTDWSSGTYWDKPWSGVALDVAMLDLESTSSGKSRVDNLRQSSGFLDNSFGANPADLALLQRDAPINLLSPKLQHAHDNQDVIPVGFEDIATPSIGNIERVEIRVTASSSQSIYLDKGKAAGIRPGDEVVLYPPGRGIANATVQSVSTNSSRCIVFSSSARVDIGTFGTVLIPSERRRALAIQNQQRNQGANGQQVPDHPAWSYPAEEWDQQNPLLAPAYSRTPEERDTNIYGRLFASYIYSQNRAFVNSEYSLARTGTALWIENPFRRGGTLQLNGELNRRGVDLFDSNEVDDPGRIDRASYLWGGRRDQPLSVEFGRFLHDEFPEFGMVDGTEVIYRYDSGSRIGFSLGALPEPFPNLKTGDDLGYTMFYRYVADEEENFSAGLGYQKTWHRGTPDRDLFIASADYNPHPLVTFHSTIWGDYYDSSDTLKNTNFEITEAIVQSILRLHPGRGLGLYFSHFAWPDLLRREFRPISNNQFFGFNVQRYGVFTWREFGKLRFDGRTAFWRDHNSEHGATWDVRFGLRDFFYKQGEVALSVFETQGAFSSGPGGRISMSRYYSKFYATLAYGFADFNVVDSVNTFAQQSVNLNLDFTLSPNRSLSLTSQYLFGDNQDAVQIGLFLQQRL